jgi:hypothetical protein
VPLALLRGTLARCSMNHLLEARRREQEPNTRAAAVLGDLLVPGCLALLPLLREPPRRLCAGNARLLPYQTIAAVPFDDPPLICGAQPTDVAVRRSPEHLRERPQHGASLLGNSHAAEHPSLRGRNTSLQATTAQKGCL